MFRDFMPQCTRQKGDSMFVTTTLRSATRHKTAIFTHNTKPL